jgi:uncharacterized protein (TIGR00730 family)
MILSVCVFCGSRIGARPAYEAMARELGAALGGAGIRLIYGGGHVGLMGAAADAAMAAGGEVVGLIPARLLQREVGHRDITDLVVTGDMFERKSEMIARSDAFAILPGGLGTLDELLEVVTLKQLGYHAKPIILIDHDGFWRNWSALVDQVVGEGFAGLEAPDLFRIVDDVEAAIETLDIIRPRTRQAAAGAS